MLLVANHPNSFLDAILIGSRFNRPVHFLARGDAFRKPGHNILLRMLKMIPVYRLSEGKENLSRNSDAFARCREILSANGIVLIFIEGISINSHELQPFKKGAARIAIENAGLESFRVLPLAVTYDKLNCLGKNVKIKTAEALSIKTLLPFDDDARNMRFFNEKLFAQINDCIQFASRRPLNTFSKCLFFLPAMLGYILHIPLYTGIKTIVYSLTKRTIFYDSVLFAALFCIYAIYLLLFLLLFIVLQLPAAIIAALILMHPLSAWAAVRFFK